MISFNLITINQITILIRFVWIRDERTLSGPKGEFNLFECLSLSLAFRFFLFFYLLQLAQRLCLCGMISIV